MNRNDDAIAVSKKLVDLVSQSTRIPPFTPTENQAVLSSVHYTVQIAIQSRLPKMIDSILMEHNSSSNLDASLLGKMLIFAALYGFADCVEVLLKYGAPVNYKTLEGQTPLMKAVGSGDVPTVALLIQAGADRAAQSESGLSVFDIAVAAQASEELVNELNVSRDKQE